MSVKVAFTSCSDPMDAPVQHVWDMIAALHPDHLVLLGDQIYMDYGAFVVHSENPSIGVPAEFGNMKAAAMMHERYQRQWAIFRASKLASLPDLKIHGIWDDHDFAWNNSFGNSGSNDAHTPTSRKEPVSRDKQQISRKLMRDFFDAIRSTDTVYPANPFNSDVIPQLEDLALPMYCPHQGVSASIPLGFGAKLLLTDGRSFRTRPNRNDATAFGAQQLAWLGQEFKESEVTLLASASPLERGKQALDNYGDLERLLGIARAHKAKVICLTGDVHDVDWLQHEKWVYEAIASGAARPSDLFAESDSFGELEIGENEITVQLYKLGVKMWSKPPVIHRSTWLATKPVK